VGDRDDVWYRPDLFYRDGFPEGITSAVRAAPQVRDFIREEIGAVPHDLILEIGPGDLAVADGIGTVVYLDVVRTFLARFPGPRVQADLFAAPFEPGTFDVVVAADVLTHVRPARRRAAVEAMATLGRNVVLFNPEAGSESVPGSRVISHLIPIALDEMGFTVTTREFVARTGPDWRMLLFTGRR
jgi:hypothetical protein